jgi:membrane protease YdiL (CAAX protease family)
MSPNWVQDRGILITMRNTMAWLLTSCFFLAIPIGYASLEWIQTTKGTWMIVEGDPNRWPIVLVVFLFSWLQLIGCCGFLLFGLLTRFRYERQQRYGSSDTKSLVTCLAWVQLVTFLFSLILTLVSPASEQNELTRFAPFLPHLWMVLIGGWMFNKHLLDHLSLIKRINWLRICFIIALLYLSVFLFLDQWVTQPVADWLSLELNSWREQSIDRDIQLAGKSGVPFLWMQWLFIGCIGPIAEEFLFRGLLQGIISQIFGSWLGILIPALLFALFHIDLALLAPLFVLGLILGWLRHYFGVLWVPILFHIINNSVSMLMDIL